MEQYNVFILVLKEILSLWTPLKITASVVAIIVAYRLPEIIAALQNH